eukprot:PhF_6_TR4493/c1_g1_i9/m.6212
MSSRYGKKMLSLVLGFLLLYLWHSNHRTYVAITSTSSNSEADPSHQQHQTPEDIVILQHVPIAFRSILRFSTWMLGAKAARDVPKLLADKCTYSNHSNISKQTFFDRHTIKLTYWCVSTFGFMHPLYRRSTTIRNKTMSTALFIQSEYRVRKKFRVADRPPPCTEVMAKDIPCGCHGYFNHPAYVHPLFDYRTNNIGHVLMRMYSIIPFLRAVTKKERAEMVAIFLVVSDEHEYGKFYKELAAPLFDGRMLSMVGAPAKLIETSRNRALNYSKVIAENAPMCFSKVYVGWLFEEVVAPFMTDERKSMIAEYRDIFLRYYRIPRLHFSRAEGLHIVLLNRKLNRRILYARQVVRELRAIFPQEKIRYLEIEGMSVAEQARIFAQTDVLIGILGATLNGPTVFLPRGSVLVQIFSFRWDLNWTTEARQVMETVEGQYMFVRATQRETVINQHKDPMRDDVVLKNETFHQMVLDSRRLIKQLHRRKKHSGGRRQPKNVHLV